MEAAIYLPKPLHKVIRNKFEKGSFENAETRYIPFKLLHAVNRNVRNEEKQRTQSG
jgi:hypothetical protein